MITNHKLAGNEIDEYSVDENGLSKDDTYSFNGQVTENIEGENNNMDELNSKINININGTYYMVTLEDNDTAR